MVQQIPFGSMLINGYQHTLTSTVNPIKAEKAAPPKMIGGVGTDTIEFKGPAPAPQPLRVARAQDPTGLINMPNPFD